MSSFTAFNLDTLFEQQFFSNLDYFFARSMAQAFDENDPIVLTTCALVSKALFQGHICIDIGAVSGPVKAVSETVSDQIRFPDSGTWITALKKSLMVSENIRTPLVLDSDHRLYLSKYYDFQNRLVQNISQRIFLSPENMTALAVDELLESYFSSSDTHVSHQKKAVKNAVLNQFTIISGGPGTGKTFVTAVITRMFLAYAKRFGLPEPRILCVAPTGKAASKMENGHTIHSVLRPLKDTPGFYYNKDNQLQKDVVIIDEASMIDISLLVRLLEAIPFKAKVIMIGDKDQLSSVQAGAVYSDICSVEELSSNRFVLDYNFRSRGKTGIDLLAKAIKGKDVHSLEEILTSGKYPDVVFEPIHHNGFIFDTVHHHITEGYTSFVCAEAVESALEELDTFKILCAHNSGEYGTLQINHVCEKILRSRRNFDIQDRVFKNMIMVNTNDYKKGLFNGDTGIVFEKNGEKAAFFKNPDKTIKQYRTSDLPGYDTAFAITIHKSQGAEFDSILMMIPDRISPVITRQLLYTGVTRARQKVIIIGKMEIIKAAVGLNVERNSGIGKYLKKAIRRIEKKLF